MGLGSHVCSGAIAQFFERGEASQGDFTDLVLTGETQRVLTRSSSFFTLEKARLISSSSPNLNLTQSPSTV